MCEKTRDDGYGKKEKSYRVKPYETQHTYTRIKVCQTLSWLISLFYSMMTTFYDDDLRDMFNGKLHSHSNDWG